jgi:plastocyanin
VLLLVVAGGCSSELDRPVKEVTATTGADQVQRVTVKAHSSYFDPDRIVVKRGVPVELTMKNGTMFVPHNFSCQAPDAGVNVDAHLGMFYGSKKANFTPSATGVFHFCGEDSHAKKGMMGTLLVKD